MRQSRAIAAALLLAALPFVACSTERGSRTSLGRTTTAAVEITGKSCVQLLAGQTLVAGSVCSVIEGDYLNVTYTTTDGWVLNEAHLWAGLWLTDLPQTNKGNPIPGQFPYKAEGLDGGTQVTFQVPLSVFAIEDTTSCTPRTALLAAHASVSMPLGDGGVQSETAWGSGQPITRDDGGADGGKGGGNWGTWFSLTLSCEADAGPPAVGTCETAYAFGGDGVATCFSDIDGGAAANRWGWVNGPLSANTGLDAGSYVFDIYAAAGQCDLNKGTKVGALTVDYNGSKAIVTYSTLPDFRLKEVHLYVGTQPLPLNKKGEVTWAPGQYPLTKGLDAGTHSYTFSVNVSDGGLAPIYVIAHAVVCGLYPVFDSD